MTALPPSPFLPATPQENAAAVVTHAPAMAAAENSVSPGVLNGSLPSGENDPSVKLDCAPGESNYTPDFDALYDAIIDPPPLFLRKPSQAFLRSLLQLAGVS